MICDKCNTKQIQWYVSSWNIMVLSTKKRNIMVQYGREHNDECELHADNILTIYGKIIK